LPVSAISAHDAYSYDGGSRGTLQVELQWQRSTFGSDLGRLGMFVVDLDGDGRNEIVAAAYAAWYSIRWNCAARSMSIPGPVRRSPT
jgi:hypothetical protein